MRKMPVDEMGADEASEISPSNVIKLPTYREIQEPTYPLGKTGKQVYDHWCKILLDQGLLTALALEAVEMLSLAKEAISVSISKNKVPSTHLMNTLRTATIRVERLNVNKTLGAVDGHDNTYARFGFAKREKAKRYGK